MNKDLALKTLKSFVKNTDNVIAKDAILALHPELTESEDERIRKDIRLVIKSAATRYFKETGNMPQWYNRIVSYLEKQKENPKTVDTISADCVSDVKWADTIITRAIVALSDDVDYNRDEPCKYRREIDDLKKLRDVLCGQKEQKPTEWSEEDKTIDQLAEEYVEGVKKCNDAPTWDLIHTAVCYGYELSFIARKKEQ